MPNRPDRRDLNILALGCLVLACMLMGCDSSPTSAPVDPIPAPPDLPEPVRELVFGVYTSDAATEMVKQFSPALGVLEVALGEQLGERVKISLKVASTYAGGVEDLTSGRVDFARMGPASYVMAKELSPGIRILVMESKKGSKTFNGVICVREGSDIESVAQLKGKRFAFGDARSTIGRFLAQELLVENGIRSENLEGFDYLGRHDKVGMAVGSGMYAAGALKEGTFKKLVAAGEPIRVIASFPNVTKPWIARAGMAPELFDGLQKVLLAMDDKKALGALKKDGFLPGDDADYDSIRSAIEASHSFDS